MSWQELSKVKSKIIVYWQCHTPILSCSFIFYVSNPIHPFSAVVLSFMCPIIFLLSAANVSILYEIFMYSQYVYFCVRYLFAPNIYPSSFCRKSKHLKRPPLGATFLSSFGPFDVHIYISMSIYVSLPRYIYFTVHIIFVLTPIKPSIRICQWVHDFKPILGENGSRCKYNCQDLTH